jgi:hypothetical protein
VQRRSLYAREDVAGPTDDLGRTDRMTYEVE